MSSTTKSTKTRRTPYGHMTATNGAIEVTREGKALGTKDLPFDGSTPHVYCTTKHWPSLGVTRDQPLLALRYRGKILAQSKDFGALVQWAKAQKYLGRPSDRR